MSDTPAEPQFIPDLLRAIEEYQFPVPWTKDLASGETIVYHGPVDGDRRKISVISSASPRTYRTSLYTQKMLTGVAPVQLEALILDRALEFDRHLREERARQVG